MKPPNLTNIDTDDRAAAVAVVVTPQDLLPAEKLDWFDLFEEFKNCFDASMGWIFKLDDTQVGKLLKQTDATMFRATLREMKIENTANHPLLKHFLDGKRSRKAGWLRKDGGISRILSDDDTHCIELAQIMFASIDTYGLSLNDTIGHAFNVTGEAIHRIGKNKTVAAKLFQSSKQLQSTRTQTDAVSPAALMMSHALGMSNLPSTSGNVPPYASMQPSQGMYTSNPPIVQHTWNHVPIVSPGHVASDQGSSAGDSRNSEVVIVEGLRRYRNCVAKSGTIKKEQQNALNAVETAAMLDASTPKEIHAVQKMLGLRPERALKMRQSAAKMRNTNEFATLTRKTRKDCMRPHASRTVRNFQHSNEYSREDTNKTRLTKVEGAEDHSQRIWTCGNLRKDQFKAFLASDIYEDFQTLYPSKGISYGMFVETLCPCTKIQTEDACVDELYTAIFWAMGDWSLILKFKEIREMEYSCPCRFHDMVRCRSSRSRMRFCHQELISRHQELVSPAIQSDSKEASRPISFQPEPALYLPATDFIEKTCCAKKHEPDLDYNSKKQMVINRNCVFGKCKKCGVGRSYLLFKCPELKKCELEVPVRRWELSERRGETKDGKKRFQKVQMNSKMPANEALEYFAETLEGARKHRWNDNWNTLMRTIDIYTMGEFSPVIQHDFSAGPEFKALYTLNCSESNGGVLEIAVCMYDPHIVEITTTERGTDDAITSTVCKRVNECEVFNGVGETKKKGKNNDTDFSVNFFSKCVFPELGKRLSELAQRKLVAIETLIEARGEQPTEEEKARIDYLRPKAEWTLDSGMPYPADLVTIWTDNCKAQYKNRRYFMWLWSLHETFAGLKVRKAFPEKEQFKDIHDNEGKVSKNLGIHGESRKIRTEDGFDFFENIAEPDGVNSLLKTNHKLNEEEGNVKVLERTPRSTTRRSCAYLCERGEYIYEVYKTAHEQYPDNHIVDFQRGKLADTRLLEGKRSHSLHEFVPDPTHQIDEDGKRVYTGTSYLYPCSCKCCREGKKTECPYQIFTKPMEHVHMRIEDYPVDQMEMMEGFLKAHFENELLAENNQNLTVGFLGRKIKELGSEPAGYKDEKVVQLWDLVMGVDDENLLPPDDDADVGCYLINETEDENREDILLVELMRTSTAWENEAVAGQNNTDAEEEVSRRDENDDPGPSNDAPPDDSLLSTQQLQAYRVPQLKDMLKKRKLAVSGKKADLISRLVGLVPNLE
jgi:hypothetical protein